MTAQEIKKLSDSDLQVLISTAVAEKKRRDSKKKWEDFECEGKAIQPATYKQLQYLQSFDNVKIEFRSSSQFLKHCSKSEASQIIDLAKDGRYIRVF